MLENYSMLVVGAVFFLKEAICKGWNVAGIDPSEESIDYCKNVLGVSTASKGTLTNADTEMHFDVITIINVLDHVSKPWLDIGKVQTMLKSEGILYLRFSNGALHSTILNFFQIMKIENSIIKFLVFHEYSFTPKFIKRLLIDSGFFKIKIRNARLSGGTIVNRILKKIVEVVATSLFIASAGRILLGPSLEVIAKKQKESI